MDSAPPRRGLGQGLALLLGEPQARPHGALREIPIEQITPNPRQPRARIDEERFAELVESVRRDGIVQPVLVRGVGPGLGADRGRAPLARRAGGGPDDACRRSCARPTTAPRSRSRSSRTSCAPISTRSSRRAATRACRTSSGSRTPRSRRRSAAAARRSSTRRACSGLPDEVLALLERGELSEGHGRALLQIEGQDERREAARAVVAGGLERPPDRGARAHAGPRAPRRARRAPPTGSTPSSRTTPSTGSTARSASPRASRPIAPAAASSCACARRRSWPASSSAWPRSTPPPDG